MENRITYKPIAEIKIKNKWFNAKLVAKEFSKFDCFEPIKLNETKLSKKELDYLVKIKYLKVNKDEYGNDFYTTLNEIVNDDFHNIANDAAILYEAENRLKNKPSIFSKIPNYLINQIKKEWMN